MSDFLQFADLKLIQVMKIIDEFYLVTIGIILIGLPTLFYLKLQQPDIYTYNIVIYGDTLDASMLAYEIDKSIKSEGLAQSKALNFNITLISAPKVTGEDEEVREEVDKEIISFCGVEKEWMQFLDQSKLKYYIKEYGVYFGEMMVTTQKNDFRIYSVESNFLASLTQYGLSNYAAQNFFLKFAQKINRTSISQKRYRLEDLTTSRIIKNIFPSDIANGLSYFSEKLGLDQSYIQSFILPVIVGNYLEEVSSLSTLYKLLPVYCHKRPQIGQSLVLFEYGQKIRQKMLLQVTSSRINFIANKKLETYSLVKDSEKDNKKYVNVILTQKLMAGEEDKLTLCNQTARTYIKSDILFIFENIDSTSAGKQVSYYKTIIDGKIKNEELYQEFFTIYLKYAPRKKDDSKAEENKREKSDPKATTRGNYNPIYSLTRICAYNCKGYENSVYVLISKHKLSSSKSLSMFQSHNIIYFKKYYRQQAQLPTNKKLQQNQNVYKIYDVDSISDSYELQLKLVKQIAQAFLRNIRKEYL